MNRNNRKSKIEKYEFILLSIVIIGSVLWKIQNYYGISIINDEFGYWGIAASWEGKTWTDLIGVTPYYSYGYSLLLYVLFQTGLSMSSIYRLAIVINALFLVSSFFLAYQCGKRLYGGMLEKKYIMLICFVITMYSNNMIQAQIAWSETTLYLLNWLLFWKLIRLFDKPNYYNTITLAIVAVFMYFTHQRTIAVLASIGIVLGMLVLKRQFNIRKLIVWGCFVVALWMIGSRVKTMNLSELFVNKELAAMNDYSGQTSKVTAVLSSFTAFRSLLGSVLGKVFYLGVSTLFIGVIGLIFSGKRACQCALKLISKKQLDLQDCSSIYVFCSVAASLLISAVYMYEPGERLDILVYGRYMEYSFGPLLLVGLMALVVFYNSRWNACLILLGTIAIYVSGVWNKLGDSDYNGICATGMVSYMKGLSEKYLVPYKAVLFLAVFAILVYVIIKYLDRSVRVLFISCIILINWAHTSNSMRFYDYQKKVNENIMPIVEKINELDQTDSVFLIRDSMDADMYGKYIQFQLCNRPIVLLKSWNDSTGLSEHDLLIAANTSYNYTTETYRKLEKTEWLSLYKRVPDQE